MKTKTLKSKFKFGSFKPKNKHDNAHKGWLSSVKLYFALYAFSQQGACCGTAHILNKNGGKQIVITCRGARKWNKFQQDDIFMCFYITE